MSSQKNVFATASLTVSLMCLAVPLGAHHGTNQSYDRSAPVIVKGVVTDFKYQNPHPALFIDVMDKDGKATHWTIEIAPTPYTLALRGWSKRRSDDALKPGTVVTATLAPARAGTPVGLLRALVSDAGEDILGDLDGALRTGQD